MSKSTVVGAKTGGGPLRRHEALPDELIELELIGGQVLPDVVRPTRRIGGPHALVRVLGLLRLRAAVELQPRREVLLAEQHAQILLRLRRRTFRDTRRIRTHARDESL